MGFLIDSSVLIAGERDRLNLQSRGEDFFLLPLNQLVELDGLATRPCFPSVGVGYCSAPVTHQDQGMGEFLKGFSSRPWQAVCPRKLSVPRRVQGLGSQIPWLTLCGRPIL